MHGPVPTHIHTQGVPQCRNTQKEKEKSTEKKVAYQFQNNVYDIMIVIDALMCKHH